MKLKNKQEMSLVHMALYTLITNDDERSKLSDEAKATIDDLMKRLLVEMKK